MAAKLTFIGAKETGVDLTTLGDLEFPADKAVLVDPDAAGEQRTAYEHLIAKAKTNRFFKVEEVKAKGRDDEDNGEEEEPVNGEVAIPPDWRTLHHKKIIAIARRLGGEGEALATRDGAIAFVEEQLALGTLQQAPEEVPF